MSKASLVIMLLGCAVNISCFGQSIDQAMRYQLSSLRKHNGWCFSLSASSADSHEATPKKSATSCGIQQIQKKITQLPNGAVIAWASTPSRDAQAAIERFALERGYSIERLERGKVISAQPIPSELRVAGAPPTARDIAAFRQLTGSMTMFDVVMRCGVPDEDIGSGLFALVYYLRDGSSVVITTSDMRKTISRAGYIDKTGKRTQELLKDGS